MGYTVKAYNVRPLTTCSQGACCALHTYTLSEYHIETSSIACENWYRHFACHKLTKQNKIKLKQTKKNITMSCRNPFLTLRCGDFLCRPAPPHPKQGQVPQQ